MSVNILVKSHRSCVWNIRNIRNTRFDTNNDKIKNYIYFVENLQHFSPDEPPPSSSHQSSMMSENTSPRPEKSSVVNLIEIN